MSTNANTWGKALLENPDRALAIKHLGSASEILALTKTANDCLASLKDEADPLLIFKSTIASDLLMIHNTRDIGSNRLIPNQIPFGIVGFDSHPSAVNFNPGLLFNPVAGTKEVPGIEELLEMDTKAKFMTSPLPPLPPLEGKTDPAPRPQVKFRNTFLVPPSLIEPFIEMTDSNAATAFLACRSIIQANAFPPDTDEDSNNEDGFCVVQEMTPNELAYYEKLLQFLYAIAHGLLPGVPIDVASDAIRKGYLDTLTKARLDLRNYNTNTPTPNTPNPPLGSDAALTRLSDDIRAFSTESIRNQSDKKACFDRFPEHKKNMLRWLCTTDNTTFPLQPPTMYLEFLRSRNIGEAQENLQLVLQSQFDVDANISGGVAASLYAAKFLWDRADEPSNFTSFYLSRMSASDITEPNSSRSMASTVREISGAPLSEIEAKAATKAVIKRPNTVDEAKYILNNLFRVLCFKFSKSSLIANSVRDVVDHIQNNHLVYDTITASDPNFPTKIVYHVDLTIQQVYRSALRATSFDDVDFTPLDFEHSLRSIQMRQFNIYLPKALMSKKEDKKDDTKRKAEPSGKDNKDKAAKEKEDQRKKTISKNPGTQTGIKLRPNEQFSAIFPQGKIPDTVPTFNGTDEKCCVKYHIGGFCNTACPRKETHKKLDAETTSHMVAFVLGQREITGNL